MEMDSGLVIKIEKERILYGKRFSDENNIDVSSTHKSDAILTKLRREALFKVIDALRLQICK